MRGSGEEAPGKRSGTGGGSNHRAVAHLVAATGGGWRKLQSSVLSGTGDAGAGASAPGGIGAQGIPAITLKKNNVTE